MRASATCLFDQTRQTRQKRGVRHVWSSSSSPLTPSPTPPPSDTLQTPKRASATCLFHHTRRTCRFRRVRRVFLCPLQADTTTRPIWDAFSCLLHFLPIRTLTCPLGRVGGRFSTARHENAPHMGAFSCLATFPPHQDTPNVPKWVR